MSSGIDFTHPRSGITGKDQISCIIPFDGKYLYVANFTKNAIDLYDAISGMPLSIFTRKPAMGLVSDGMISYVDPNAIAGPTKMVLNADIGARNKSYLYICNQRQGIVLFDLRMGFTQIRFSDHEIGNQYLDASMHHYSPLDVSLGEDRIIVLYARFGYVIYDGKGSRINTIELGADLPSWHFFTYFDGGNGDDNNLYIKTLHQHTGIITKYDKNGIITNFFGDEYGCETGMIADCVSGLFVMHSQLMGDSDQILHIMSNNMLYLTDYDGKVMMTRISPIPLTGNCEFTFDFNQSILWVLMDQSMIYKIQLDDRFLIDGSNKSKSKSIPFHISYRLNSPYYPTTNMEVIQYMTKKRGLYDGFLRAVDLSKKYMSENKEYFYIYDDVRSDSKIKIPHYELIFAVQQKFMMGLAQYRVDPYVMRMPQHFGSAEYRDLDKKYAHYCGPQRRGLYLGIIQLYEEALFYQKFIQDLRFVVEYDSYQNLVDDVKLSVSCEWNGRRLFPRVYGSGVRKLYNKRQCEVLRTFFL
jgi:hypothetical protein